MDIIRVNPHNPKPALIATIEILEQGGVVIFPTDTFYGLLANALNVQGVEKVYAIKQRNRSKQLPIMARNLKWVDELAHVTARQRPILESIWPGAVTAVLHRKRVIPDIITNGHATVAVRIPDYPLLDQLLGRYGYPLTMTAATVADQESSQRVDDVVAMFRDSSLKPDLVIDVGTLPPAEPSTLLDLTGDHPKILRVGATKPQQLMELLKL